MVSSQLSAVIAASPSLILSGTCRAVAQFVFWDCHHGISVIPTCVPKKIREPIGDLKKAGFVDRGGKGSHRNFVHPSGKIVVLSGSPSKDAKRYQEKQVREGIEEVKK